MHPYFKESDPSRVDYLRRLERLHREWGARRRAIRVRIAVLRIQEQECNRAISELLDSLRLRDDE